MKALSILIPEYNCECTALVESLCRQRGLERLEQWEIIVADDGSTNRNVVAANQAVNELKGCRFIPLQRNMGRAAIRNFLAQNARYDRLLFIDAGMSITDDNFITRYISVTAPVVYGGYKVIGCYPGNLRFKYEKHAEPLHRAAERQKHSHQDFHTSNYLIERAVALAHPFDTTFVGYGYEDVAYGRELCNAGIAICHIDNPVGFYEFESNESFLAKTEESLITLYHHREQLAGYSRLIRFVGKLHAARLHKPCLWLYRLWGQQMRQRLVTAPQLWMFTLYKIGFYLSVATAHRRQQA